MQKFDTSFLKKLYRPPKDSHKGQNGKLLIIGGSKLFHAASLWSLTVASRIVDMVYYASIPENNQIVQKAKEEFRNGIVIRRNQIDEYIEEADCVLIGPGLPRKEGQEEGDDDTKELTEKLLTRYSKKRWVVDGGSLQMIDPEVLLGLKEMPIVTPHKGEFETLFDIKGNEQTVSEMAKKYNCVILLKGVEDVVCSPFDSVYAENERSAQGETRCIRVSGGNAGMTKGGTGDVLAGLTAALYCKNDAFLAATCASYINKKAGDELFKKVGYYFNASDLADEIPKVMASL